MNVKTNVTIIGLHNTRQCTFERTIWTFYHRPHLHLWLFMCSLMQRILCAHVYKMYNVWMPLVLYHNRSAHIWSRDKILILQTQCHNSSSIRMQTILFETVICAEYKFTAHHPVQTMKNGRCKYESKHFVGRLEETKPARSFTAIEKRR